jgi:hypothetical protein
MNFKNTRTEYVSTQDPATNFYILHSISFFGVKDVKHESCLRRNPHPYPLASLAVGGLSPALCALSHSIFSSLCWLLFTIAMAPQSISIDISLRKAFGAKF